MAITIFISLYATRLILNALGAKDFGIFNVVGGAIAMLTFLNSSMASATQRFMSYSQGEGDLSKQKKIFNVSVVLHLFIGLIVVALMEIVGYFLFNGILSISPNRLFAAKLIFHFLAISTFFTIISVPYDAVINAHENMLFVAIIGIFEASLKLCVALYITFTTTDKLISYGALMAGIAITLMLTQRIYCHIKYDEVTINIRKHYDKHLFKEMTSFAGWSFMGNAASMTANYGQGIVINMFFGTMVNAAQGVANQLSGQLSAFASTMLKALNPVIGRSAGAGNRELMLKAAMFGSKFSFFLMAILYIPALVEMPYILNLWLKHVPDYAIIFCRLLLIKNLIEQFFLSLSSTIMAVGNIKKYGIYTSLLTFTPLVISYFLFALKFGPVWLYIVFILYSLSAMIMVIYFAKVNCDLSINMYIRTVILRCVSVFVIVQILCIIPLVFLQESFFRLLLVLLIATIGNISSIWIIGFTNNERESILQIIKPQILKVKSKIKLF
ncbi:MAG: MATE family efflux transporter [Bacteroidales bacterium]|nr:MATE family efflux transporter [Bacteroidales bacterium]